MANIDRTDSVSSMDSNDSMYYNTIDTRDYLFLGVTILKPTSSTHTGEYYIHLHEVETCDDTVLQFTNFMRRDRHDCSIVEVDDFFNSPPEYISTKKIVLTIPSMIIDNFDEWIKFKETFECEVFKYIFTEIGSKFSLVNFEHLVPRVRTVE